MLGEVFEITSINSHTYASFQGNLNTGKLHYKCPTTLYVRLLPYIWFHNENLY